METSFAVCAQLNRSVCASSATTVPGSGNGFPRQLARFHQEPGTFAFGGDMCTKRCSRCHAVLPVTVFGPQKGAKDGLQCYCRPCQAERARERRAKDPERYRGYSKAYRERNPGVAAESTRKWKNAHPEDQERRRERDRARYRKNPEKFRSACREYRLSHPEQVSAAYAKWREANREHVAAYGKHYRETHKKQIYLQILRWKKNNPAKVRAYHLKRIEMTGKQRRLPQHEWLVIKQRYYSRCVYCGASDRPLTQDHVIPLSKGGLHDASNVVPACRQCNSRKRDDIWVPHIDQQEAESWAISRAN